MIAQNMFRTYDVKKVFSEEKKKSGLTLKKRFSIRPSKEKKGYNHKKIKNGSGSATKKIPLYRGGQTQLHNY